MLMYVYLGLILFLLIFVLKDMFRQKNLISHIYSPLVVVPLILRLLLIK